MALAMLDTRATIWPKDPGSSVYLVLKSLLITRLTTSWSQWPTRHTARTLISHNSYRLGCCPLPSGDTWHDAPNFFDQNTRSMCSGSAHCAWLQSGSHVHEVLQTVSMMHVRVSRKDVAKCALDPSREIWCAHDTQAGSDIM